MKSLANLAAAKSWRWNSAKKNIARQLHRRVETWQAGPPDDASRQDCEAGLGTSLHACISVRSSPCTSVHVHVQIHVHVCTYTCTRNTYVHKHACRLNEQLNQTSSTQVARA